MPRCQACGLIGGPALTKSAGKGRFLVVEDEEEVARLALIPLIRPYGDITLIEDYGPAERLIEKGAEEWTGVLMDVRLPGGSGLALLRLARVRWPLVPAMLMTGYNDDKAANTAFDLRADYVIKPWKAQRIRDRKSVV